eukprot:scaffold113755_cov45-Phaeocystis_antarctica.AAC.2
MVAPSLVMTTSPLGEEICAAGQEGSGMGGGGHPGAAKRCLPGSRVPTPLSPRSVRRAGITILSMPRGPSDVRTASATALAATMLLSRTLPEGERRPSQTLGTTPEASGGRAEP